MLQEELREQIEQIESKMREKRWPRLVFGTFCGLLAAAYPGAQAIQTGEISSALGALPGLINAVYHAFSGTPNQREILNSPLAYAALSKKQLNN